MKSRLRPASYIGSWPALVHGAAVLTQGAAVLVAAGSAHAATLPQHAPLSVLVVSDEVNPNGLSDAELSQPGDVSAALNADDSGLNLVAAGATEVSSQCIDDALTALEGATPPDVVVYFAHRGALGCDGQDRQAQFTADIEQLLIAGGGLVVFHHGIYAWSGKDEILDLIGAESNSIAWDTQTGQRIFNVAPDHFVTSNGLTYDQSGQFEGTDGVPAGDYAYFDNIPDERYPNTSLLSTDDETREILFASNSGGTRVVGYTLTRPAWTGRVVAYQSGEYQPNALDARDGRNFQILANAIVYSTGAEGGEQPPSDDSEPIDGTDAGTGTEPNTDATDDTDTDGTGESEPSSDDVTDETADDETVDDTDAPTPDTTDGAVPDDDDTAPTSSLDVTDRPAPSQVQSGADPIDPPMNDDAPPSGDPAPTASTTSAPTAVPASSDVAGAPESQMQSDDSGGCSVSLQRTGRDSGNRWTWLEFVAVAALLLRRPQRTAAHVTMTR